MVNIEKPDEQDGNDQCQRQKFGIYGSLSSLKRISHNLLIYSRTSCLV